MRAHQLAARSKVKAFAYALAYECRWRWLDPFPVKIYEFHNDLQAIYT